MSASGRTFERLTDAPNIRLKAELVVREGFRGHGHQGIVSNENHAPTTANTRQFFVLRGASARSTSGSFVGFYALDIEVVIGGLCVDAHIPCICGT
jgi:hypothetical protein